MGILDDIKETVEDIKEVVAEPVIEEVAAEPIVEEDKAPTKQVVEELMIRTTGIKETGVK